MPALCGGWQWRHSQRPGARSANRPLWRCHQVGTTRARLCFIPSSTALLVPVTYVWLARLNSGPLGEYAADVGNRTTIRMSYPEGTPLHWVDSDPDTVFVAVVYKGVDVSWTSAMINRIPVVSVPVWCHLNVPPMFIDNIFCGLCSHCPDELVNSYFSIIFFLRCATYRSSMFACS